MTNNRESVSNLEHYRYRHVQYYVRVTDVDV